MNDANLPTIQQSVARLQSMADEAIKQYDAEILAGGEPAYPAWVDDLKQVCKIASNAAAPAAKG